MSGYSNKINLRLLGKRDLCTSQSWHCFEGTAIDEEVLELLSQLRPWDWIAGWSRDIRVGLWVSRDYYDKCRLTLRLQYTIFSTFLWLVTSKRNPPSPQQLKSTTHYDIGPVSNHSFSGNSAEVSVCKETTILITERNRLDTNKSQTKPTKNPTK